MQRFRGTLVIGMSCAVIALAAAAFGDVPDAQAFNIDKLRERIEDRISQLERRVSDRESSQQEDVDDKDIDLQPTSQTAPDQEKEEDEAQALCECSARLGVSRPDVRWQGSTLQFIPRFDLKIRVRHEDDAPPWNLALAYSGVANNTPFSGQQKFGGQCFDGRYEYTGLAGTPVSMTDIARSLFNTDDEQELLIRMDADLSGCDVDSEHQQAEITIEEFGNLDVGRWRRAR